MTINLLNIIESLSLSSQENHYLWCYSGQNNKISLSQKDVNRYDLWTSLDDIFSLLSIMP